MEADTLSLDEVNDTINISTKDTLVVITDSTKQGKELKPPFVHQVRFGVDISRFAFNLMYPSKQAYDFQIDYALRNNVYAAAETGFGSGKVAYDKLNYKTNAYFIRLGVDKSFLNKIAATDFDIGFLGFRYGMGVGQRQAADFKINSPFGTQIEGTIPQQNFVVHWVEIVGGLKVELWKGVFAGWTGRGKFLLNSGVFKELAPNYIAGYGKGDKNSSFDFNFYISYSIKWGKEEASN